jgi:hypothetical protein
LTLQDLRLAATRTATGIVAAARPDVVLAYGVFLVLAVWPSLVTADAGLLYPGTLADLLGGRAAPGAAGGGSGGLLLVLLAAATVFVPYLWRRRIALLAAAVPLLVTLAGFWPLYRQQRAESEAIDALAEFGLDPEQIARAVDTGAGGPLGHVGVAAWCLLATAIYLACRGAMRALAARGAR